MKKENMQKNFIEKLISMKKLLETRFNSEILQDLDKTMNKLAHYHYHKKDGFLVGRDRDLYNFLIENGYNPYTAYRWLLLERLPDDIKFQIKNRQISQKTASNKGFTRRHEIATDLSESIRMMGLTLVKKM